MLDISNFVGSRQLLWTKDNYCPFRGRRLNDVGYKIRFRIFEGCGVLFSSAWLSNSKLFGGNLAIANMLMIGWNWAYVEFRQFKRCLSPTTSQSTEYISHTATHTVWLRCFPALFSDAWLKWPPEGNHATYAHVALLSEKSSLDRSATELQKRRRRPLTNLVFLFTSRHRRRSARCLFLVSCVCNFVRYSSCRKLSE